jgi:excisionase family DNA binding protein
MGDSILHRRAAAAEAADRFRRRSELWAEARAEREAWRREMVPPAIAAELLGISRNTLGRWAAAGRITAHKLGPERQSPTRFRRADIDTLKSRLSGEPVPQADEPEAPADDPSLEQLAGLGLDLQATGPNGPGEPGADHGGERHGIAVAGPGGRGEMLGERGPERIERVDVDPSERQAGGEDGIAGDRGGIEAVGDLGHGESS